MSWTEDTQQNKGTSFIMQGAHVLYKAGGNRWGGEYSNIQIMVVAPPPHPDDILLPSSLLIPIFAVVPWVCFCLFSSCINIFHVIIIRWYVSFIYSFIPQHFVMENLKLTTKMKILHRQRHMSPPSRLGCYHLFSRWVFIKVPAYVSPLLSLGTLSILYSKEINS